MRECLAKEASDRLLMPSAAATTTTPSTAASSSPTTASAASFAHRHSRLPLIIIPIPLVLLAPRTLLPSPAAVPLSHLRLFHFLDRFALSFSDSFREEHRFLLAGGAKGVLGHLLADDACFGMMSAREGESKTGSAQSVRDLAKRLL